MFSNNHPSFFLFIHLLYVFLYLQVNPFSVFFLIKKKQQKRKRRRRRRINLNHVNDLILGHRLPAFRKTGFSLPFGNINLNLLPSTAFRAPFLHIFPYTQEEREKEKEKEKVCGREWQYWEERRDSEIYHGVGGGSRQITSEIEEQKRRKEKARVRNALNGSSVGRACTEVDVGPTQWSLIKVESELITTVCSLCL